MMEDVHKGGALPVGCSFCRRLEIRPWPGCSTTGPAATRTGAATGRGVSARAGAASGGGEVALRDPTEDDLAVVREDGDELPIGVIFGVMVMSAMAATGERSMQGARNRRPLAQPRRPRPAAEQVLLAHIKHHAVGWWAARWLGDRLPAPIPQQAQEWRLEAGAAIRALAAALRELRQASPVSGVGAGAPGATA